jgi:hypothetical protein
LGSLLLNCTVVSNLNGIFSSRCAGGVTGCNLTNCIVLNNSCVYQSPSNSAACSFGYSCTMPLQSGTGNIAFDPHFLQDNWHLADDSPCRSAGLAGISSGVDLDGQAWANPPSMGCDEWSPEPLLVAPFHPTLERFPIALNMGAALIAGQEPIDCYWYKDGALLEDGGRYSSTHSTNLIIAGFGPTDAGNYYPVLSNAYGISTGAVSVVVHCVDAAGKNPVPPFSSWAAAATNLQDAVNAAAAGDFVLVTNGFYASGGAVVTGDLTNRVVLLPRMTLSSINGPQTTVIQGARDPATTNGPGAVRCVWMGSDSTLNGFTVQGGATRTGTGISFLESGGGICCDGTTATLVKNCLIRSNTASMMGGGCAFAYRVDHCKILQNSAQYGGGCTYVRLFNSLIESNSASQSGGGLYWNSLSNVVAVNCTFTRNSAPIGGGVAGLAYIPGLSLSNCIVYGNWMPGQPEMASDYYQLSACWNCCLPSLSFYPTNFTGGCITNDPQLLSDGHLALSSPCRGMGAPVTSGTDIDGEQWLFAPSIGCDEVVESALTGPLSVSVHAARPVVTERGTLMLFGDVTGRATSVSWDFGDGTTLADVSSSTPTHTWTNAGDYTVTFTASNPTEGAVSSSMVVHVIPLVAPQLSVGSFDLTNFHLSYTAQPGVHYAVEQTTNLTPPVVWKPFLSNWNGAETPISAVDPQATNAARFYRIRIQ